MNCSQPFQVAGLAAVLQAGLVKTLVLSCSENESATPLESVSLVKPSASQNDPVAVATEPGESS